MFENQCRNRYEKNVDNMLMFLVVARKSKTFQIPIFCWCAGAQEAVEHN